MKKFEGITEKNDTFKSKGGEKYLQRGKFRLSLFALTNSYSFYGSTLN